MFLNQCLKNKIEFR